MSKTYNTVPESQPTRLELNRTDAACINNGRGGRIFVERGAVWITQERCRYDYFVEAGQSFRITRSGVTVVSTIGRNPVVIVVSRDVPAVQSAARRSVHWLAGLFKPRLSVRTA